MKTHLYLSLFPEALILSQLTPAEFGRYLASGPRAHAHGQALFMEVDPGFSHPYFRLDVARSRCVPHDDGSPKNSVYVSIYKVLEHVPLSVLGSLYLVTEEGRTLALEKGVLPDDAEPGLRMYQEICPKRTMVASNLAPGAFGDMLTKEEQPLWLPKVVYCDLDLGELADDPEKGSADNLPYPQIEHIRDCLRDVRNDKRKSTKTVFRALAASIFFRTVKTGFYVAASGERLYYPMPERSVLETTHYSWWRSAARGSAF